MRFTDIFKDTNDINEKSVVGFISFVILVIISIIDLIFAMCGKALVINQFIHEAFIWITLGSFGVSAGENVFGRRKHLGGGSRYNDRIDSYDNDGNELG